jgi:hypothetical protein
MKKEIRSLVVGLVCTLLLLLFWQFPNYHRPIMGALKYFVFIPMTFIGFCYSIVVLYSNFRNDRFTLKRNILLAPMLLIGSYILYTFIRLAIQLYLR